MNFLLIIFLSSHLWGAAVAFTATATGGELLFDFLLSLYFGFKIGEKISGESPNEKFVTEQQRIATEKAKAINNRLMMLDNPCTEEIKKELKRSGLDPERMTKEEMRQMVHFIKEHQRTLRQKARNGKISNKVIEAVLKQREHISQVYESNPT